MMTPAVTLCEVGPRDGLQTEPRLFSVDERVRLIERLADAGLGKIEAVSFVNPKRVPQMADAEAVMAGLSRRPGVEYAGLALNARGVERALVAGVAEVRFAVLATETFNRRNQGAAVAESVATFAEAARLARDGGVRPVGIVSAAFGCPFEGTVAPAMAVGLAQRLADAGAEHIVFADTIGAGVPTQVRTVIAETRARLGDGVVIGAHFHNTRNTGFANAVAAIEAGATVLDASIGGLGGCPFAPDATGNVAMEDLAHMLRNMGFDTGVDLAALTKTVLWLEAVLGRRLPGQLARARAFPECAAPAAEA